jgi:hypothetical protein
MKKTKAVKTPKKTKKVEKDEGIKLTDEQIEIVLDNFYSQVQGNILDIVFEPYEKNQEVIDDMIEFVICQAIEELPKKFTDKAFEAKVIEIMKEEGISMAQDLFLAGAKSIIEEMEEDKNQCPIHGKKPPKKGDFNTSRGLN